MRYFLLTVLLITALLLVGCAGATPPATATPALTQSGGETRLPSATPLPTRTPQPTITPQPSPTATITVTPTLTPDPALADVRLLGVSWQRNYDLLLSIQFPGPVDSNQYRVKVEDKWYECQVLPQEPARLYCIGQGMRVYDRVNVQIYPTGSDTAGFEGSISIPYFTN